MTFKAFVRTFGAAALVGGASLAALPAAAQDESPRERHREMRETRGGDDNAAARQEMRQQRMQAAQQAREYAAPQAQERAGRDWNRGENRSETGAERMGRGWNNRDNSSNDWGQARAAQAQAEAQARQQQRAEAQGTQRWERNRSYADRSRNRTYGSVDTAHSRSGRGEDYRHGYRDAVRGNRPGDGHHGGDQSYSGRVSDSYAHGYRDARSGYRPGDGHHDWDRAWRSSSRYNWYGYRNANRSLFSIGTYYSPYRNYRYSRLGIGYRLNSGFYGSRYWINDPWQYRLPPAYGPYRWIRYYDDALLVNIYTGQVEDVIYDFFW